MNGRTLDEVNGIGEPIYDDSFLLLFNPHHEPVRFVLPRPKAGTSWEVCFDTRTLASPARRTAVRKLYNLIDRSMAVLQEAKPGSPPIFA